MCSHLVFIYIIGYNNISWRPHDTNPKSGQTATPKTVRIDVYACRWTVEQEHPHNRTGAFLLAQTLRIPEAETNGVNTSTLTTYYQLVYQNLLLLPDILWHKANLA